MGESTMALGWRVHSWSAVVVAVDGTASSPVIVHRQQVLLVEDEAAQEPFHNAAALVGGRFDDEDRLQRASALIAAAEAAAAAAAASLIEGFVESLGPMAAIGVVGGDRAVQVDLPKALATHARLHASERDLYERAVIAGAERVGLPVATVPATAKLFDHASQVLGHALEPTLSSLGASVGRPWQKDHKEATAAALVALAATSA